MFEVGPHEWERAKAIGAEWPLAWALPALKCCRRNGASRNERPFPRHAEASRTGRRRPLHFEAGQDCRNLCLAVAPDPQAQLQGGRAQSDRCIAAQVAAVRAVIDFALAHE